MAKLGINTGTTANDGTGDSLRVAGGKINTNFDEIYSAFGDGTNLSAGIVTNITAGNFISISTSFGDVTITGLANTENITSQSLIVSGISTLGIVTGATSLSVGPIYADSLVSTGSVIANTLVGDGSQITGLATTETVHAERLLVTGITTLGVVTDTTSIQVTDLYATNITGDGTGITFVPYSGLAGVATYATNSGVSTYATNAGVATYATNAGLSTNATYSGYSTLAGLSTHSTTAGVSSYTSSWTVGEDPTNNTHYRFTGPGVSTTQDDPEFYLIRGGVYRFTNQMGRHPLQIQTTPNGTVGTPYTDGITNSATINGDMIWNVQFDAPNQLYYQCTTHTDMGGPIEILNNDVDFAGYADVSGIATYASNAGVATYASSSGISTYATNAGIATNATTSTYATNAGIATYATNAGIATNATTSTYATNAGVSTYATNAGIATYATNAGIATYATNSGIATYATNAGISTYASSSGFSTNSTYAGYATTSGISTVSVNAQGLTGTPDIDVDSVTANELIVSGVSTLGVVTGATYYGDGTNLTGLVLENTTQSFDQLVVSGMSTVGFLTGAQSISGNVIYASSFVGDGSQVTGVVAEGSIGFALDDTYVGAGFTQLDYVYEGSVSGSFVAVGNTGRYTITGLANTAQTKSESLVVTGISTLGVITGATSLEVGQIYGTNFTGNSGSADQVKTQTQSLDVNYNVTFVEGDNGSPTNETVYTEGSLTYNTFSQILSSPNVSVSSSVTAVNFYGSLTGTASNATLVSGTTTSFLLDYNNFTNAPTVPTNNNQLTNGAGYITTSFTNTNQLTNGAGFVTTTGDGSGLVDGRWTLGADGTNNYTFTGVGFTQTTNDPDLYLARGRVYEFVNEMEAHPFQIQDTQNGSVGNPYNNGVTNNGASNGTVKFEVPFNAPDTLYYQCESHTGMGGTIFIYPTLR